jgi:hypothetical protein
MLIELGKASVETKGSPFLRNTEVINQQVFLYQ